MPRGDGTGPMGAGAMTGRAGGYCAGTGVPDFANTFAGRGFGAGFGRNWPAWGQGLGFGAGRWGRRSMPSGHRCTRSTCASADMGFHRPKSGTGTGEK